MRTIDRFGQGSTARRLTVVPVLLALLATLLPTVPSPAAADSPTIGEFRVSNYADGFSNNNWIWRGYAFKVTRDVVVTHLIGGAHSNCVNAGFAGGIYGLTGGIDEHPAPNELLAGVTWDPGTDPEQEIELDQTVTLEAGGTYLMAQGRATATSNSNCHWVATSINVDDLLFGSPIMQEWRPNQNLALQASTSHYGSPESLVAESVVFSNTTDVRPLMGLKYETDVTPAEFDPTAEDGFGSPQATGPTSVELQGSLGDSGATEGGSEMTALYFEYSTNADLSGSSLQQAGQIDGPVTDSTFTAEVDGLTSGQTYYYRSIAVNENGRSEGSIREFAFYPDTASVTEQPHNMVAGEALAPRPAVQVRDHNNDPIVGRTVTVTLNGADFAVGTTTTVATDENGFATFADLVIETAGTDYTLTFSAAGMADVISEPFAVAPDDVSADTSGTIVTVDRTTIDAGESVTVTVELRDRFGNPTPDADVPVSVTTDLGVFPNGETTIDDAHVGLVEDPDGVFTSELILARAGTATVTTIVDGAASEQSATVEVEPRLSGPISELTGRTGNGQVVLTWQPPVDDGGADVDGYRVEVSDDDGATWSIAIMDTESADARATVTELTNGTDYRFRVTPVTVAGTGASSDQSEPVRPRRPAPAAQEPEEPAPSPVPGTTEQLAKPVPGGHQVSVGDGQDSSANVESSGNRASVVGANYRIDVWAADGDERSTETGVGNVLRLPQGGNAGVSVEGFAPHSSVRVWLFSEPRLIGEFETDADGALDLGLGEVVADLTPCAHTLQAEGTLADGQGIAAALGVWVTANPFPFADVAGQSMHAPGIGCLEALDIIEGFSTERYEEGADISRAQAASVVARTLGLDAAGEADFEDVRGVHSGAIAALVERGVVRGTVDGRFSPQRSLTRGQAASILADALGLPSTGPARFEDVAGTQHEAGIAAMVELGVLEGFDDGTFRPNEPVTRGQFASMVARILPEIG